MANTYIALAPKLNLHYFLNNLQIRDGLYAFYNLNTLQENIIKLCDGHKTVKDIFNEIVKLYGLDGNDNKIRETFFSVLEKFFTRNLLIKNAVPFGKPLQISGEPGKAYPYFLSWEVTNACNFRCPHCYKEAEHQGVFASDEDFELIVKEFKGKSRLLSVTGGEAMLHPKIATMLDILCDNFTTDLVSNGVLIPRLPTSVIKKLSNIQVCMYGFDNDSYYNATGYKNGYDAFAKTVSYILDAEGRLSVTLIAHRDILGKLDKFVQKLVDLNVKDIAIGQSMPVGRATSNDSYLLNEDDCKRLTNELTKLTDKYHGIISVSEFQQVKNPELIDDYKLTCQAGRDNITISEKGCIRQCHFFPSDLFSRKLVDYVGIIKSGVEVDYTTDMQKFENYLKKNGKTFADMHCMGFNKV